jgi:hypothetical protein
MAGFEVTPEAVFGPVATLNPFLAKLEFVCGKGRATISSTPKACGFLLHHPL